MTDRPTIQDALRDGGVIDMTTTGRQSGVARRIEILLFNIGGRLYISGMPSSRRRSWLANLDADPRLTIHIKERVVADVPATARIIDDPDERRSLLTTITRVWQRSAQLDAFVASSPLIEVTPDDTSLLAREQPAA